MFTLGGDPAAIRGSGRQWSSFAEAAHAAGEDVLRLDAEQFLGDEADTYRERMSDGLPPQLGRVAESWGIVGAALTLYADELESYQTHLSRLTALLTAQQEVVASKQAFADRARQADTAAAQAFQRESADSASPAEHSGMTTTAPSPTAPGATAALTEAQAAAQRTTDAANGVLAEHRLSLGRCCGGVDRAKALRFEEPPGFWGRVWDAACKWVAEHSGLIKFIYSALKQLSSIAGLLAMVPFLAPVMGPIAIGAGAAAVGLDAGVTVMTGEGDWSQILMDGAAMIPGARAAKVMAVGTIGVTAVNVAQGKAGWEDLAMTTAFGVKGLANRGGTKFAGSKPGNSAKPSWMGDVPTRREARRHASVPFRAVEHEPYWPRPPDSALSTGQPVWHDPHATAIGGDRPTINNFSRSGGSSGEHDVVVHGLADGRPYAPQGSTGHQHREPDYAVNTQQIAEAVRTSPYYVAGTPVRFISCHAARGSAQELADSLGVPVRAVRHPVRLDDDGTPWVKVVDAKTKRMGPPKKAVMETFDPARMPATDSA
ncbi:MAG: hypothetical protein WKF57_01375 [Nakamurella sp.]